MESLCCWNRKSRSLQPRARPQPRSRYTLILCHYHYQKLQPIVENRTVSSHLHTYRVLSDTDCICQRIRLSSLNSGGGDTRRMLTTEMTCQQQHSKISLTTLVISLTITVLLVCYRKILRQDRGTNLSSALSATSTRGAEMADFVSRAYVTWNGLLPLARSCNMQCSCLRDRQILFPEGPVAQINRKFSKLSLAKWKRQPHRSTQVANRPISKP